MCGISGLLLQSANPDLRAKVRVMNAQLAHRGPDGDGEWCDERIGIALGHRRLAILDLSPGGRQPMASACGRYVIAFNGEVYNHADLRRELSAVPAWQGHSDTEVMLAAISAWGLKIAIGRFVGMFAFALWDRRERALHLVRDRLGEKPLYYSDFAGTFAFASELKALVACYGTTPEIDRGAVQALMQLGYIPAPLSIYHGVHKLPPGCMLKVQVAAGGSHTVGPVHRYWNLDSVAVAARTALSANASDADLEGELNELLMQSVRGQMVADVPLGAFLSGGIDSSLVVALMQRLSSNRVRTFTIGFREEAYNEAHHAKRVAQHIGTDHTELYVSPADAAAVIPDLPQIFDEPFADSSQIPTFLVAQMTRRHVTVSLSGDGGDELFGGYPRYVMGEQLWNRARRFPLWSRSMLAAVLSFASPSTWDGILSVVLPRGRKLSVNGHRIHRLARVIKSRGLLEMYCGMISQWQTADGLVLGAGNSAYPPAMTELSGRDHPALNQLRQFDIGSYLPDDILVKVDRASMSRSLESRAPFLDHRVAEFAWALPRRSLVRDGRGKWLMRKVLERYVPRELTDRPKAGFGMPVGQWLRTELRPWAQDLLDEGLLRRQGFLAPGLVRRMWDQHLAETHDRQAYLWNVLMFQAWLNSQNLVNSSQIAPPAAHVA